MLSRQRELDSWQENVRRDRDHDAFIADKGETHAYPNLWYSSGFAPQE